MITASARQLLAVGADYEAAGDGAGEVDGAVDDAAVDDAATEDGAVDGSFGAAFLLAAAGARQTYLEPYARFGWFW